MNCASAVEDGKCRWTWSHHSSVPGASIWYDCKSRRCTTYGWSIPGVCSGCGRPVELPETAPAAKPDAVPSVKPTLSWGEAEYRTLTPEDMDKLCEEIGEHFGHSSLHCIAFDGLRDALKVCQIANGINAAVASMRAK